MSDETPKPDEATAEAEPFTGIVEGDDLRFFMRWFGVRDPGPLKAALEKDPELAQFLYGGGDEVDKIAAAVDDAVARTKEPDAEG